MFIRLVTGWSLVLLGLPVLAVAQHEPAPLWQLDPPLEERTVPVGELVVDAQGWATRSLGPPELRVAVDPETGASGSVGLAGIPLPVNGGSLAFDFRLGDICFNVCFVEDERLQRLDGQGDETWSRLSPVPSFLAPTLGPDAIHEWPGLLVVASGAVLRALDSQTGAVRWSLPALDGCTVALVAGDAEQLTVSRRCLGTGQVLALDPQGQIRWQYPLPGELLAVAALGSGSAVLVRNSGQLLWQAISRNGDGIQTVRIAASANEGGTLLSAGSRSVLLTGDRQLFLLSPQSSAPLWAVPLTDPDVQWQQLLAHDSERDQVLLLQRLPAGDEVRALALSDGGTRWTHPLPADERLRFPDVVARAGLPPGPVLPLVSERVSDTGGLQRQWYGLQLRDGALRWRQEVLKLPVRQESQGFVLDDQLVRLRHTRDNGQPALLVDLQAVSGQPLAATRIELPPALLTDDADVRLRHIHNQDRIAVQIREAYTELGEYWVVLDRTTLEPVAQLSGTVQLAADRGHFVPLDCYQGRCLGARYFAGSGGPDWELSAPEDFALKAVHHDGIVVARTTGEPAIRFITVQDGERFERASRSFYDPVLRLGTDRFLLPMPSGTDLQLISATDGTVLGIIDAAPITSFYSLENTPSGLVKAYGRGSGSQDRNHQLLFGPDLVRRAHLPGPWADMIADPVPAGATEVSGWLQSLPVFSETGRIEQLTVPADGTGLPLQRRTVQLTPPGSERFPVATGLAVRGPVLVLQQSARREAYVPVHRFAGIGLPALARQADLAVTVRLDSASALTLVVRNQGPDPTRARLDIAIAGNGLGLTVRACGGHPACVPGAEPPAALDLGASESVELKLDAAPLHGGQFGYTVVFTVDADAATSDVQRANNRVQAQLLQPLLANGFE